MKRCSIRQFRIAALLSCILAACGTDDVPLLSAEEVTVFAPLPGQPAGVAYFSLHNNSSSALVLLEVTSPDFAAVTMHTTMLENGIAHMMPLDLLTIAERSQVDFSPGGPHLMLMQPRTSLAPGDEVTLQFHFDLGNGRGDDVNGVLAVRSPVLSR